LVRQELKQDEEDENKYLKGMAKLFRISNLPAKLAEVTQNKMEMPQSNQTLRS
jgi:protoporphyrinogen oxidase